MTQRFIFCLERPILPHTDPGNVMTMVLSLDRGLNLNYRLRYCLGEKKKKKERERERDRCALTRSFLKALEQHSCVGNERRKPMEYVDI